MESAKNEPQMPKAVAGAVGKAKESSAGGSDNGWVRGWFSNSPSQTKSDVFESSGIPVTVSIPDGKGSYASVEEALAIPQKFRPDVNSLGRAVKDGNERFPSGREGSSASPIATALPLTNGNTTKDEPASETREPSKVFTNSEYINRRLNILVAGASGLGKTTLLRAVVQALCRQYGCMEEWENFLRRCGKDVVKTTGQKPEEIARLVFPWSNDTKLIVTIIDSRGFGDQLDERKSFEPIQQFIKQMYDSYSQKYDTGKVSPLDDPRVHCCLYFLQPTRFRENDAVHMKALEGFVPIVPIIAKADTLTIDEINEFLLRGYCTPEQVREIKLNGERGVPLEAGGNLSTTGTPGSASSDPDLQEHDTEALGVLASIQKTNIDIFRLENNASPSFKIKCLQGPKGFKVTVQDVYSIVARDKFLPNGDPEPRPYPWGDCSIQKDYHSDFSRLEAMLFRGRNMGMKRLIEETENRYFVWRSEKKRQEAERDPVKRNNRRWVYSIAAFFLLLIMVYVGPFFEIAGEPSIPLENNHTARSPGCARKECSKHVLAADARIEKLLIEVKSLEAMNQKLTEKGLRDEKTYKQRILKLERDATDLKATNKQLKEKILSDQKNYKQHIYKLELQTGASIKRETEAIRKKLARCREGKPEESLYWIYEWMFTKLESLRIRPGEL
jgi:septin family protein